MKSRALYTGDGTLRVFAVPFPYLSTTHVKVFKNRTLLNYPLDWGFNTDGAVEFRVAPQVDAAIEVNRVTTDSAALVQFQNGAVLTEQELNTAILQMLYLLQETRDDYSVALGAGLHEIATGTGIGSGTAEEIINATIAHILDDELTAFLQQRINDISLNADGIIENALALADLGDTLTYALDQISTSQPQIAQALADALDALSRIGLAETRLIAIEQDAATVTSRITTLETTSVSEALRVDTLTADLGATSAALQVESLARADGISALALQITTLQAFTNHIFIQDDAPLDVPEGSLAQGDIWYDSDNGNHPYRWTGTEWLSVQDQLITALQAQIVIEQQARVDADSALASSITTVQAQRNLDFAVVVSNNQARIDGDAANAVSINGLIARVGTAEAAIVTEQSVRAAADSAAASTVNALGVSLGTTNALISTNNQARVDGDAANASSISVLNVQRGSDYALIVSNNTARINGDAANTTLITGLTSRMGSAESAILTEQNTRATADSAQVTQTNTLITRVGAAEAATVTEQTARVNADGALSTRIDAVVATAGAAGAAVVTEQTARANADGALSGRIDAVVSSVATNAAAVTNEATARASADTAEANARLALAGRVDTTNASIVNEASLRVAADAAEASARNSLQTTVNGHTSTIQAQASSIDGLFAQYTVKIDNNGYMSGFGLASTPVNGVPISSFIVLADKFAIVTPGQSPTVPFSVDANGVYMDTAYIRNLTVDMINGGTIGAQWNITGAAGRIVIDTGTHMKVMGVGFGANADLIEWFGLKMPITSCAKANAITYVGMDGSAYFGGSLSAGTLFNSTRASTVGVPSEATLGPYATAGNSKTIVLSYVFNVTGMRFANGDLPTGTSATIQLYRRIGSGAETLAATLTCGEGSFVSEDLTAEEPMQRYFQTTMAGSVTISDNVGGTDTRTYRAVLTARTYRTAYGYYDPAQPDTLTQTISIASTEQ
jgi:hypothetical protein